MRSWKWSPWNVPGARRRSRSRSPTCCAATTAGSRSRSRPTSRRRSRSPPDPGCGRTYDAGVDDDAARIAIVDGGARLGARRLIAAAEGNISVRLSGDRLVVTPSGQRKDELRPGDLVVVPLQRPADGDRPLPDGRLPTSDIAIHRRLMHARRDVSAVAHAHLPVAMALTLAGERP